jgi:cytochrome c oxidase cbb3-type subunit I
MRLVLNRAPIPAVPRSKPESPMVSASTSAPSSSPSAADLAGRTEAGPIDASSRAPVLLFVVFGALWLLSASGLALVASVQLHNPGFFGDSAWLTYGRARPAWSAAFVYGWGFNAAFALALWLMARLSGTTLRGGPLAVVGGLFWNLGVILGVLGIHAGDATGFAWLELPRYVAPLLLVAYALIGASGVATFRFARFSSIYVSQWYLLGALFWFPWLYSIVQATLLFGSPRGVVQTILAAWYGGSLYGLWLAPIALAAIYYFLPKILGRPVYDYRLARMGFWTFVLFASWAGVRHLIGGPVPIWVQGAGSAAGFMLLVPVLVVAVNSFGSLIGQGRSLRGSPTLGFITIASAGFVLAGIGAAVTSLRGVAEFTQFTYVSQALLQLELYAFFSMAAFGGIYYIVPRLVRSEWPSAALISAHFWTTAVGAFVAIVCLTIGGWVQGSAINDVDAFPNYVDVVGETIPFLVGHSLALVLLAIGHLAFAANLGMMLLKRPAAPSAVELFRNPAAMEVVR